MKKILWVVLAISAVLVLGACSVQDKYVTVTYSVSADGAKSIIDDVNVTTVKMYATGVIGGDFGQPLGITLTQVTPGISTWSGTQVINASASGEDVTFIANGYDSESNLLYTATTIVNMDNTTEDFLVSLVTTYVGPPI
jgi:hypothetical protein